MALATIPIVQNMVCAPKYTKNEWLSNFTNSIDAFAFFFLKKGQHKRLM